MTMDEMEACERLRFMAAIDGIEASTAPLPVEHRIGTLVAVLARTIADGTDRSGEAALAAATAGRLVSEQVAAMRPLTMEVVR